MLKDTDLAEQYFIDAWEIIKSVYRDNIRMRKINEGLAKLISAKIAENYNILDINELEIKIDKWRVFDKEKHRYGRCE